MILYQRLLFYEKLLEKLEIHVANTLGGIAHFILRLWLSATHQCFAALGWLAAVFEGHVCSGIELGGCRLQEQDYTPHLTPHFQKSVNFVILKRMCNTEDAGLSFW